MKSIKIIIAALLVVITLVPESNYAQKSHLLKDTHIRLGFGSSLYYGDVRVYPWYAVLNKHSEYGWTGSLSGEKYILPWIGVRGEILYGSIAGTKRTFEDGGLANLAMDAIYQEYSLSGIINFSRLLKFKPSSNFGIYGFAGIGYFKYNTELNDLRYFSEAAQVSQWEKSKIESEGKETSLIGGIGVSYKIYPQLHIGVEGSIRPVISDKIDGVKGGSEYDMLQYISIGLRYDILKPKEKAIPIQKEEVTMPNEVPENKVVEDPELTKKGEPETHEYIPPVLPPKKEPAPMLKIDTVYRVQIAASKTSIHFEHIEETKNVEDKIFENKVNSWYCYSVGEFESLDQAQELLKSIKKNPSTSDAFVVGYVKGERFIPNIEKIKSSTSSIDSQETYSVQILSLKESKKTTAEIKTLFDLSEDIISEEKGVWTVYYVEKNKSFFEAKQLLEKMKKVGFHDAFIITFEDGRRLNSE